VRIGVDFIPRFSIKSCILWLEILEADPTAKFNRAIAVPALFPCRAWASPQGDIAAQARARRQAGRAG